MAEPLLRRTLSRLRGKEKCRRKTEPKAGDAVAKSEADGGSLEEGMCKRGTPITVSKKQNWARLPPACSIPSAACLSGSGSRTSEWDCYYEKGLQCDSAGGNVDSNPGLAKSLAVNAGAGQQEKSPSVPGIPELHRPALGFSDSAASPCGNKITGQGAYLQSLDRSSRAWVLSSGKPEEATRHPVGSASDGRQRADGESKGDIWYNPIPEEEGPHLHRSTREYGDPWKLREGEDLPELPRPPESHRAAKYSRAHGSNTLCADLHPTADSSPAATSIEPSGPEATGARRSESSDAVAHGASSTTVSSDSPGAQKKTGMMDRIKSPGTVRRLSLKMKKLPELRRRLSLRSSRTRQGPDTGDGTSPTNARKESGNVISRYHLDTSVSARDRPHRHRGSSRRGKSAGKGGYLSDGDSPELLTKHGGDGGGGSEKNATSKPDPATFRPYSLADQPRCAQRVSGLINVHLFGVEEVKSPRVDSKEVFCAIQVDGVTRARTALLTCRGSFLSLNHTFNLELENAQLLKLVVFSWDSSSSRNRVCCLGAVTIPPLFRGSRSQQLAVKLEPRGLLYVKMTLVEQWDAPARVSNQEPRVFGVELQQLVEKEASRIKVPLLIQKSVAEIEKRGLKVVGLYRLCGSAAVKKELRDAFERDSVAVTLSEELYPDINVVTGILKDYLRELPSPLITRTLYEVVLDAMNKRPLRSNSSMRDPQRSAQTVQLLNCLPDPEKATLTMLLDHLSLVASYSDANRMTSQNLAVCFGPVLLTPGQEPGVRSFAHCEEIASAVDFKRHIEALHYMLQLWPLPRSSHLVPRAESPRRLQRPVLHLDLSKAPVVSRRGKGRIESPPCNRYAGDWSVCGRDILARPEVDYDEVAGTDSDEEEGRKSGRSAQPSLWSPPATLYVDDFPLDPKDVDIEAPFTTRLSLKDFDKLISDLERELGKKINICL
ncbi:rho GTPase-activating protein SYDE1 isoform X1 [Erpetoichthys calabaricus]|uniref:rho GTPase-activating protein SYDE1 isoform X1 n=1 Tax=Erpetoichthys calabaricus TaxID=27687 RepID=UPI0022348F02|nr:rho GTPase-activating protein SYDE1 isoform X1 [Erpetoichthys calabaricus]